MASSTKRSISHSLGASQMVSSWTLAFVGTVWLGVRQQQIGMEDLAVVGIVDEPEGAAAAGEVNLRAEYFVVHSQFDDARHGVAEFSIKAARYALLL